MKIYNRFSVFREVIGFREFLGSCSGKGPICKGRNFWLKPSKRLGKGILDLSCVIGFSMCNISLSFHHDLWNARHRQINSVRTGDAWNIINHLWIVFLSWHKNSEKALNRLLSIFPLGQNLYVGTSFGSFNKQRAYSALAFWWAEKRDYDTYNAPAIYDFNGIGHFTQMAWANSNKVGCAHNVCDGEDYFACNYQPR